MNPIQSPELTGLIFFAVYHDELERRSNSRHDSSPRRSAFTSLRSGTARALIAIGTRLAPAATRDAKGPATGPTPAVGRIDI